LIVRVARPDDAAAVAGVHVRSWQQGYRGLLPDDFLDDQVRSEEIWGVPVNEVRYGRDIP
jgi:hypothetical protein